MAICDLTCTPLFGNQSNIQCVMLARSHVLIIVEEVEEVVVKAVWNVVWNIISKIGGVLASNLGSPSYY